MGKYQWKPGKRFLQTQHRAFKSLPGLGVGVPRPDVTTWALPKQPGLSCGLKPSAWGHWWRCVFNSLSRHSAGWVLSLSPLCPISDPTVNKSYPKCWCQKEKGFPKIWFLKSFAENQNVWKKSEHDIKLRKVKGNSPTLCPSVSFSRGNCLYKFGWNFYISSLFSCLPT